MTQAPEPIDVDYAKVMEEIKDRRQGSINYRASDDMVDRVRAYEKAELALPPPSARGEGIDKLSLLDPLTELYNFRTFLKELKAELTRAKRYKQPCAIVLLTIDNFEEVVQQYGYVTGDAILKVVANVMRTALREVDIPAKYGTQEFAVILPQTGPAGGSLVAERLRQRIGNQAVSLNWQSFSVTASAGVASYPAHATAYDELIARAMEALQWALERGGDRVLAP
ncbi:MAG TPA: GGDEF domain-containing protein [Planktothrix sp.]|jgi:two-component system cell cycle response regulator